MTRRYRSLQPVRPRSGAYNGSLKTIPASDLDVLGSQRLRQRLRDMWHATSHHGAVGGDSCAAGRDRM